MLRNLVEPERDYLLESYAILGGHTMLQPERRHLEALLEQHECNLIKLANELEALRKGILA